MNAVPWRLPTIAALFACCNPAFADRAQTQAAIDSALAKAEFELVLSVADAYLLRNPRGNEIRFGRAQALVRMGANVEALGEFELLTKDHPENVDYAFGHAQVLSIVGRDSEARAEIARATRLAPGYEDVWRFRHQLLSRQGDEVAMRELARLRQKAETRFPRAKWWRVSTPAESASWTFLGGGSVEQLSGGLPGWNAQFAEISRLNIANTRYFFRVARDERFDRSDSQLAIGADWLVAADWNAGLGMAWAPGAEFQPDAQYSAHVGRQLAKGWNGDIRYRRRSYETAVVDSYAGLIEHYFGDFRAAWSLTLSHLHGAGNSIGHTLYLNWYRTERTSFGISFTRGDETEAIGAGQVLETTVKGLTLTGRHGLTPRVSLDWWLGRHEQGDFYRRQYAGMAVSVGI